MAVSRVSEDGDDRLDRFMVKGMLLLLLLLLSVVVVAVVPLPWAGERPRKTRTH